MTLNDLKNELSVLGFEREISIDKSLVFSARRALSTIYTERGVYNTLSIEHAPIMPTLICKSFVYTPNQTKAFKIKGKAVTFYVSGTGAFSITENDVKKDYTFSSHLHLWRLFIKDEATLAFYGEYSFKVIGLAVFDNVYSDSEDDLFAYGEAYEYDLSRLCDDFHSFASLPTNEYGREISGASMRSPILTIPWNYQGRINITYKSAAPHISEDTPNETIPIPKEIEHLVPLLTAAYYWVDDAPDKAEYYLSLYKDSLKAVKQFDTRVLGNGYRNVTRWV